MKSILQGIQIIFSNKIYLPDNQHNVKYRSLEYYVFNIYIELKNNNYDQLLRFIHSVLIL